MTLPHREFLLLQLMHWRAIVNGRYTYKLLKFIDARLCGPAAALAETASLHISEVLVPPHLPADVARWVVLGGIEDVASIETPIVSLLVPTGDTTTSTEWETIFTELPPHVLMQLWDYLHDQWTPWINGVIASLNISDTAINELGEACDCLHGMACGEVIEDIIYSPLEGSFDESMLQGLTEFTRGVGSLVEEIAGRDVTGLDGASLDDAMRAARSYHSALVLGQTVPTDDTLITHLQASVKVSGIPCQSVRTLRELMEWIKFRQVVDEVDRTWFSGLLAIREFSSTFLLIVAVEQLLRNVSELRVKAGLEKEA